ncbi:MAG: protein-export chaperone SecB [Hyphomicrobiaceae bacterium]|nr:protein-export chaperone SecB [Hyphomicrobiaceae bacterium]
MSDPASGNGASGNQTTPAQVQVHVRVLGQYIKDLSFESPNIRKLLAGQQENPSLNLELNVHPESVAPDVYEAALQFKARAETKSIGTIYELELVYAGLFRIENVPAEAIEPMLNINCPTLLFPFLRRIAADLTREGGFPPLLLDPVDFGSLYMRKRAALVGANTARA